MIHDACGDEPTPQEKRRQATEARLRAALQRLIAGMPNHPSLRKHAYQLTVSTLAREARVSRNTIYANHRSVVDALDSATPQATAPDRPARGHNTAELAAVIEQLRQQKRQLATENAALLRRALDAEKTVDRLKKQNAKLVHELATARQPVTLSRGRP